MRGSQTADHIHDILGIGLGPFNLSLACLMAPLQDLDAVFLERKSAFSWHDGMMIPGTTLQNNFMADLVTLADPTSPFSYLNYCKQNRKIYHYYFRENFYLTRQEYNRYCQWAAAQLQSVHYNRQVTAIEYDQNLQCYIATVDDLEKQCQLQYRARRLVVGIGSVPNLPDFVEDSYQPSHTGQYLRQKSRLQKARRITVIGSGQSGAEIYYDLLREIEQHGYQLYWITRSSRFFQMETGKLTLELITPDYAGHFYRLQDGQKKKALEDQVSIFNGINTSLIERIYDELDEKAPDAASRTHLYTNMALIGCQREHDQSQLTFEHMQTGERYLFMTDEIVFATGYRYRIPEFMQGIADRIRVDSNGRYCQAEDYAVDVNGNEIYIQNAGFESHGLTNPDLGLNCFRNARIINAVLGRQVYGIEQATTFQSFTPRGNQAFSQLGKS